MRGLRVRAHGDTAIATLAATVAWRYGAGRGRTTAVFTPTYVRERDGWLAAHASEVRRPKAEKAPESAQ